MKESFSTDCYCQAQITVCAQGQRVYGLTSGHRRPRASLIATRIGQDFAEPVLFEGTCDTAVQLLAQNQALPAPHPRAPCHHGQRRLSQISRNGAPHPPHRRHTAVSTSVFADLNTIEHANDFAALKKHREYHETASIDEIVKAYQ
jgi:putative transposase